uniref:NADH-ubiquinone oxidoreductase chain 6 n=1 Tax=Loxoblemmus equestris TaxID=223239 RepID=A0A1B1SHP6_9ORTH|nr:NADH dehydrogenase subunit 6 [Loxoblemmus equestris]
MIIMSFMFIMLLTNMLFSIMIHPLSLTLLIIVQTLMICLISGPISYSFWFSYILFMVFLGGMLVLFIYITSLASNEMFLLSMKMMFYSMMITILMMVLIMKLSHTVINQNNKNDSMMTNMNMLQEFNNLNQLYNHPNFNITIITIMYLLFTLIVIVKITEIQEGPLRKSY